MKNYYKILGLTQSASSDDIRNAYRQLARSCHPDLHPNDATSAALFKELNTAYMFLLDPLNRAALDSELRIREKSSHTKRQTKPATDDKTTKTRISDLKSYVKLLEGQIAKYEKLLIKASSAAEYSLPPISLLDKDKIADYISARTDERENAERKH